MSKEKELKNTNLDKASIDFYSNAVFVGHTPYDMEIIHHWVGADGSIRGRINIKMNPDVARLLKDTLEESLSEYEEKHMNQSGIT